jgi:hypothetical protein
MRVRAFCDRLAAVAVAALILTPIASKQMMARQETLGATGKEPVRGAPRCFEHSLRIGMTKRQALQSDWCYPNDVEKSANFRGRIEYWFYGQRDKRTGAHTGMVLIDDGVVTYFSDADQN